jgi:hypothetical protein
VSAPVLALPNFSKPFHIQTDACDSGVGAVLLQEGHPLAFVSKALGPRTRNLSTYDRVFGNLSRSGTMASLLAA